ncbi:hypothetical protein EW026_g4394, partial [Hermanssonia centrifuga]
MIKIQTPGYKPVAASWQEMGGIHGVPYTNWSGDPNGPDTPVDDSAWEGYCYHSSALFPQWHRVVMLLVEQSVTNEARAIVGEIEKDTKIDSIEKTKWRNAGSKLRFPYWDWSDKKVEKTGFPKIFIAATVDVIDPHKPTSTMALSNPLMCYIFEPIPAGAPDQSPVYFSQWVRTYRWATRSALTNDVDGPRPITAPISVIRSKLARVFSFPAEAPEELQPTYWEYFSDASKTLPNAHLAATLSSLEEPHNKIHLDIGGTGNMSYLEMAEDQYGTYQEKAGAIISEDSCLPPFRKDSEHYWVAKDVRGLQPGQGLDKYYTYPPLTLPVKGGKSVTIDVMKSSTADERIEYIAALREYYKDDPVPLRDGSGVKAKPRFFYPDLDPDTGYKIISGYRDFVVVGSLSQYAFRGSHRLELFLDESFVGDVSVFSRLNPEQCEA